jgi:hypothetical protein
MDPNLSLNELQQAAESAETFMAEHGDCGLAFETIMTMCFIKQQLAALPTRTTPHNPVADAIARRAAGTQGAAAIPDWFRDGLKTCQGRRLTASQIMTAMGRPTDIGNLRLAGVWLRQLYGEPHRSGGQTLFIIPGTGVPTRQAHAAQPAGNAGDDEHDESQFAPGIPLGSKAVSWCAQRNKGIFTPVEIANALGHPGTAAEVQEIGKALHQYGFHWDDAHQAYDLGAPR